MVIERFAERPVEVMAQLGFANVNVGPLVKSLYRRYEMVVLLDAESVLINVMVSQKL